MLIVDFFDSNAEKGHGIKLPWPFLLDHYMNKLSLIIATLPVLLTGCFHTSNEATQSQAIQQIGNSQLTDKQEQVWQQVTVVYNDFEGGFYGLTTKAGVKLLPMNLAKQYKLPGTVLKVKGVMIKDMATMQQWGEPFKITDIELIKLGHAGLGDTF